MLLIPLDATQLPDLGTALQRLASQFTLDASQLMRAIDGTVIDISRLVYIMVLLVGAFLYSTRLVEGFGRDLMVGDVLLAILSEFALPLVTKT
jgi:hypothetical protein